MKGTDAAGVLAAFDRADEYLAYIANCPLPAPNGAKPPAGLVLRSVREILADPELSAPPEPVVPRLAYARRISLPYGREKIGKSSLLRAGAAAVSTGSRFLGEETKAGQVLWVALEEYIGDTANGLAAFGCNQEGVVILDRVTDPIPDLETAIDRVRPVLVVIDTLAAFVTTLGLEPGSSKDWAPVVLALARIAHDSGVALVILHHGQKGGNDYRDSTAIGASVDLILGMAEGDSPDTRSIRSKGRWRTEDFAVRLVGDRYELAAGELSLDARVLYFIETNPQASTTAVRAGVQGQAKLVDRAIDRLLGRGAIVDSGGPSGHKYEISGQGPGQGGLSLG